MPKDATLNIDDLDPAMAEAVREREAAIRVTLNPMRQNASAVGTAASALAAANDSVLKAGTDEMRAAWERNQRAEQAVREQVKSERKGWRAIKGSPFLFLLPLFAMMFLMPLVITLEPHGRHGGHDPFLPFIPMIAPMCVIPMLILQFSAGRKRKRLPPQVLSPLLAAVAQTPGERAYAGAVSALLDSQAAVGEATARELIESLNALLMGYRKLEAQHDGVQRAMNAQSLAEMTAERDSLRERLATVKDPVARETLTESLALCEGRLERAEALAPTRERLEAQQEAALQVMASTRVALAGFPLAAAVAVGNAGTASAPQQSVVRESASRLQRQTVAVENAVQEVLRLQA